MNGCFFAELPHEELLNEPVIMNRYLIIPSKKYTIHLAVVALLYVDKVIRRVFLSSLQNLTCVRGKLK